MDMLKRRTLMAVLAGTVVLGLGLAPAVAQHEGCKHGDPAKSEAAKGDRADLPKCPISGKPANLFVSTTTDDGPVYFCCAGCINTFKADAKGLADKVKAQREALAKLPKVQVACPVTGKPVSKKVFAEKDGHKVYFATDDAKAEYEKNPAQYAVKLANCYTYQTKCPVSGGNIDPAMYRDLPGGQRVYYCCPSGECHAKLVKDPEKYAANLAAQGYQVNVETIKKAAEKKGEDKP